MQLLKSTPSERNRRRPWLWFNLLSLDAPIVAILWQQIFTRTLKVPATKASGVTLAVTVWLIYALDRVLDAWGTNRDSARHRFYQQHWRAVIPALLAAVLLAGWYALSGIRRSVFQNGIILLLIVGVYFAIVHIAPKYSQRWWPKEMAVGLIFALGTCIHVWTLGTRPLSRWAAPLFLFAVLCWINCAAIAYWEAEDAHVSTWWLGRHLSAVSAVVAASAFVLAMMGPSSSRLLPVAEGVSALGFIVLDQISQDMSTDALRVAADAVLCSPALLLPFT
jgi:hypothetical protein